MQLGMTEETMPSAGNTMNQEPILPHTFLTYLVRRAGFVATSVFRQDRYRELLGQLPKINGPALVVGSAPNPTKPKGVDDSWFRISVNGSQFVLEKFGLGSPNFTVFQSRIFVKDERRKPYWEVLSGRSTETLLLSNRKREIPEALNFLASKNYKAARVIHASEWLKGLLASEVTGAFVTTPYRFNDILSNGMFAALLALRMGASPVVMSGFSVQDGWSHAPSVANRRKHLVIDAKATKLALERGYPLFTSELGFSERMGIPLWRG